MARGIRLKSLRSTDLEAIGVPDAGLTEVGGREGEQPLSLLAEADPVLSRALDEVRQGLEETLRHLEEVLSTSSSTRESPPPFEE